MSGTKKKYVDDNVINLQGKEYLRVAHRVVLFRKEHPDWSIRTNVLQVNDDYYVKATISNGAALVAEGHKRVRTNGRGPAAQWPLETAETGAIGRALALCGYGTLAGDLDEHDELADAPEERVGTDVDWEGLIKGAKNKTALRAVGKRIKAEVPDNLREQLKLSVAYNDKLAEFEA